MDNTITYTNYIVVGEPTVMELSNGSKKFTCAIRSQHPHFKGANNEVAFNKVYLTAFDRIAENMQKYVQEGSCISVFAEQVCYLDKNKTLRHNYNVLGFNLSQKPDSNKKESGQKPTEPVTTAPEKKEPQPETIKPEIIRQGLNDMADFMTN